MLQLIDNSCTKPFLILRNPLEIVVMLSNLVLLRRVHFLSPVGLVTCTIYSYSLDSSEEDKCSWNVFEYKVRNNPVTCYLSIASRSTMENFSWWNSASDLPTTCARSLLPGIILLWTLRHDAFSTYNSSSYTPGWGRRQDLTLRRSRLAPVLRIDLSTPMSQVFLCALDRPTDTRSPCSIERSIRGYF